MPGAEACSVGDFVIGGKTGFGASLTGGVLEPTAAGDSHVGVVEGDKLTFVTPGGAFTGALSGVVRCDGGDLEGMPGIEACSVFGLLAGGAFIGGLEMVDCCC